MINGGIRFGGLASGMDTESIIKKMVDAKRIKVDRFVQQRITNEFKSEAYSKVNKDLANFILEQRKALSLENVTFGGRIRPFSINKVDWSQKTKVDNENAFTASSTAGALLSDLDVTVKQLAKNASVSGGAVSDLDYDKEVGKAYNISLKVNGRERQVRIEQTDTVAKAIDKIRKATDINLSYVAVGKTPEGKNTNMLFMSSKESGSDQSIQTDSADTMAFFEKLGLSGNVLKAGLKGQDSIVVVNGNEAALANTPKTPATLSTAVGSAVTDLNQTIGALSQPQPGATPATDYTLAFEINGKEENITVKADTTYAQVISELEKRGLKVTATKGSTDPNATYSFKIETEETGAEASIKMASKGMIETSAFLGRLGIDAGKAFAGVSGEGAKPINGEILNRTNNITIGGINLNLKKEGERAKVSVSPDVDSIYDKIKGFVESYNKVIDSLQKTLKEKKFKDYPPLTPEQRKALGEEEIKLWDEKAKSGLLNNDNTIKSMISKIRESMYQKVDGAYAMYEIGITTGNWKEGAKLVIDDAKLKEAIGKDSKGVLDTLFKASEDVKDYNASSYSERLANKEAADKQRAETGVFSRIMDEMANGMQSIININGDVADSETLKKVRSNIFSGYSVGQSVIERQIALMNKKIDAENDYIDRYEDFLWDKFTAMEKMVQQANAQGSWLASQMGGGGMGGM